MTKAEDREMTAAFMRFASDVHAEIRVHEAEQVLRWLGYQAPFNLRQLMLEEVDIDKSGAIGIGECKKLVRRAQEHEMEEVDAAFAAIGPLLQDREKAAAQEQLRRHLNFLGCHEAAESLEPALVPKSFAEALQRRREMRQTFRENEGFSREEVRILQGVFRAYDLNGNGRIGPDELRDFCEDSFPEMVADQLMRNRFLDHLSDAMGEGQGGPFGNTGDIDFPGFLRLMRNVQTMRDKRLKRKETLAARRNGFTKDEVKEFRTIFVEADKEGLGRLHLDKVASMIHRMVPLGDTLKLQFRELWHDVLNVSDERQEGELVDFTGFLDLWKRCLNVDFAGLGKRTQEMAQELRQGYFKMRAKKELSTAGTAGTMLPGRDALATPSGSKKDLEDESPETVPWVKRCSLASRRPEMARRLSNQRSDLPLFAIMEKRDTTESAVSRMATVRGARSERSAMSDLPGSDAGRVEASGSDAGKVEASRSTAEVDNSKSRQPASKEEEEMDAPPISTVPHEVAVSEGAPPERPG